MTADDRVLVAEPEMGIEPIPAVYETAALPIELLRQVEMSRIERLSGALRLDSAPSRLPFRARAVETNHPRSQWADSNRRPALYQSDAPPVVLHRQVGANGFEPLTVPLSEGCSTKPSYAPMRSVWNLNP